MSDVDLAELHAAQRAAMGRITVGSIIHDGIAIGRVIGEGKAGQWPAWEVELIHPWRGQRSVMVKDSVIAVMVKDGVIAVMEVPA